MIAKTTESLPDQPSGTMRASRLHGIRDVRIEELPRPRPGPGEVLLKVASVGVCGSDVHYYLHGRIGIQVVTAPIIMGHEFSARVAGLGSGVNGLEIGQLVSVEPGIPCKECEPCQQGHPNLCPKVRFCGTPPINGVFAEYTVMPAENCFPLPPELGPVEGAMLEPLGIAMHSVDLAHLRTGDTVAVLGAGPIGLLIAAVARAAGASEIYMTEPLAYRRQFALEYIADAALDPGGADLEGGGVVAEIMRLTGGRGVDTAFEAAGDPGTPQQAAAVTRIGGKVIIAGIAAGEDTITMNASTVRHKGLTIKVVRRMKHTYPRAIRLVQSGLVDVKPLATHLLPLERIEEAFEMVAGYHDGVLRAVIQISE
ncbi:MAG TPA: alcohol dehydrogenase catalytic domain-containing protein [Anaerolineae bacterium]|nr:alcohol dehydrogenase catalytic domain-containing protein [Anaerolineae bacterium]